MTEKTKPSDSVAPQTDQTTHVERLHGVDRSGLGKEGWAEVPEDRIGGHPELETVPKPDGGDLNGPAPEQDPITGGVRRDPPKTPD
jgi:hypothetical protein